MIHTVDYRAVYSSVLAEWLQADPVEVFGEDLERFNLVRTPMRTARGPL